jgi:m7GpppX diphosphatase
LQVESDSIRAYFHYLPSFYHLHMHLVNVTRSDLGSIPVGKAILVDDVMDNIELKHDYYQTQSLSIVVGEQHVLWAAMQQFQQQL